MNRQSEYDREDEKVGAVLTAKQSKLLSPKTLFYDAECVLLFVMVLFKPLEAVCLENILSHRFPKSLKIELINSKKTPLSIRKKPLLRKP